MRPAGKGLGGEGSAASFSPSVGKRDSGSLSSKEFPPSSEYLGKGLGGEGSFETETSDDVGIRAGRAIVSEMRSATIGERVKNFMAIL